AQFRSLVERTRAYLDGVPKHTGDTNAQLMEIMMAQDFQDLTGQVIKKTNDLIQFIEQQLLQLLLENTPPERRKELTLKQSESLLNGPAVSAKDIAGALTSQAQVDDLLGSLGF